MPEEAVRVTRTAAEAVNSRLEDLCLIHGLATAHAVSYHTVTVGVQCPQGRTTVYGTVGVEDALLDEDGCVTGADGGSYSQEEWAAIRLVEELQDICPSTYSFGPVHVGPPSKQVRHTICPLVGHAPM